MRKLWHNTKYKKIALVSFIILLITLPFIIFSTQQKQQINTRADFSGNDYAKIRESWFNYETGGNYDTSNPELNGLIAAKVTKIASDGRSIKSQLITSSDRKYLFSDKNGPNGGDWVADTYERIEKMALAYSTKGAITDPNEKEAFYIAIKDSLIWLNNNWYNSETCKGNVFNSPKSIENQCSTNLIYEVGIPRSLTTNIILIYDRLSQDPDFTEFITKNMNAVERFYPNPRSNSSNEFYKGNGVHDTAGNLAMTTVPLLLRAGISNDPIALDEAIYNYNQKLMQYTNSSDGIYSDGSFIQHEIHPYNMWYGSIFFRNVVEISRVLSQSNLASANTDKLYRYYKDSFQPFMFNESPMDMVMGRLISYPRTEVTNSDLPLISSLAGFISSLSGNQYKDLGSEILNKTNKQIIRDSIFTIIETYKLIKDPNLISVNNYEITKLFPRIDKLVSLKNDYAFGISMSSGRIGNYESINGDNKKGWYTSDGMIYFYNKTDPGQYNDYFWATVDKTKLPGTTIDETIKLSASNTYLSENFDSKLNNYMSPKLYAGGSTLNTYVAVGMNFKSKLNVFAKKSYFIFDNELVALGSNISATNNQNVQTIIENRKIKNDNSNIFQIDNKSISSPTNILNPKWAFLEGTGGYYFPISGNISAQKQSRSGNWKQIKNTASDLTTPIRNYAQILINHGVNPTNEKYAYVFLPNSSQSTTSSYAQKPDISILAQNSAAHAVKENKLNITAANFFGSGNAGDISSSGNSSIIVDEEPESINISIADPTQENDSVNITINKNATDVISKDPQINVTSTSPIKFSVNMKNSLGNSFKISFSKNNTTTPIYTLTPTKTPTPSPNPTKTPTNTQTPSPIPNTTKLKLNSVKLHGIGSGGDATNNKSGGNLNPARISRSVTLELNNSSGSLIMTAQGNINYSPNTGDFSGIITLPSSIDTGNYLIKIKSPQFLKKQYNGIINVTKGSITNLPAIILVSGDVNNDNILSILDFKLISDCYSDFLPAKNCSDQNKKNAADISDDGKVDQDDYNLYLRELSIKSGD